MTSKAATKGSYGSFRSDISAEKEGVVQDYGRFRVTIARAGGANKSYERILTALTKPYTRAIQTETLDPRVSEKILKEAMAKAVILNWEVLVGDEDADPDNEENWRVGVEDPDTGDVLDFTWQNVFAVLKHPEIQNLYQDLRAQSGKEAMFLQTQREDAGNV